MLLPVLLITVSQVFANTVVLQDVTNALDNAMSFINDYGVTFNIDGYYGCTLAVAQLEGVIEEGSVRSPELLLKLQQQICGLKEIIANGKARLPVRSIKEQLFFDAFLNVDNWKKTNYFNKTLIKPESSPNIPIRVQNHIDYEAMVLEHRQFNEAKSDNCFLDNILSKILSDQCSVSDECASYIYDPYIAPAYNVTHRLLFTLEAQAIKCGMNEELLDQLQQSFCSFIYWEANIMGPLKYRKDFGDLFLEQVLLCSVAGYGDFLRPDWLEFLVKSQSQYGCYFSSDNSLEKKKRRRKRESNPIIFGCSDHTTGLAIALLGIFTRALIQESNQNMIIQQL